MEPHGTVEPRSQQSAQQEIGRERPSAKSGQDDLEYPDLATALAQLFARRHGVTR